jgi:hypothetical protein
LQLANFHGVLRTSPLRAGELRARTG